VRLSALLRLGSFILVAACAAQAPTRSPTAPGETYLEPNTEDQDGTPAYVHFEAVDMPLRVSVDWPREAARYASVAATREAVIAGLRVWETALAPAVPGFALELSEADPDAHIRIEWKRRIPGDASGHGGIGWALEDGKLLVFGGLEYTTETCPNVACRLTLDELTLLVAHEFGHALGLGHCLACDSIMSYEWDTRERVLVTGLDVATYQALVGTPNGLRVDSRRIGDPEP
jgi:hypothetical protein